MTRSKFLVMAAVLAISVLSAESTGAAGSRYRAWVSCASGARPSHSCYVGDLPAANFRDLRGSDTRYRLCVTRPTGRTICRLRTTGSRASTHRVALPSENVGWHRVRWSRGGRVIARWSYYMNVGD